jgi:MFS-type transporter involved in bile tolerance (Atg22 family)
MNKDGKNTGKNNVAKVEPFEVEKQNAAVDPLLIKERFGFLFETFARGPDTVFYGSVYFPALILFATSDSICDVNSGAVASGKACTVDSEWNRTLWLSYNGSACAKELSLGGGITYEHNMNDAVCANALNAYQGTTGFTCNCSSDYAFLDSGLRAGNAVNISYIIINILVAITAPLLGIIIDRTPIKKKTWVTLAGVASVFTFLSAITGTKGLWQFGLLFATIVGISTELIWVAKSSFLEDIAETDNVRGELGGRGQCYSFASQLIFLLIVAGLTFGIGGTLSVILGCFILGAWFALFETVAVRNMRERQPKLKMESDKNYACTAIQNLKKTLGEIYVHYPQVFRYLVFKAIGQNGAGAFLSLYTTYFVSLIYIYHSDVKEYFLTQYYLYSNTNVYRLSK